MIRSQSEQKPQPGDLIEIFRGSYQHWAIYVGEGYVIHLAPPCEYAQAGANSMISVLCDKAVVKKEPLWDVVRTDRYIINNLLDDEYEPLPISVILLEAHRYLNQELPYCLFRGNCEHFVTEMRYGKAESRQVRNALLIGAGVVGFGVGIGVLAYALKSIFSSEDKDKQSKQ